MNSMPIAYAILVTLPPTQIETSRREFITYDGSELIARKDSALRIINEMRLAFPKVDYQLVEIHSSKE